MKAKGISSLENQLSAAFAASEDTDEGDVLGINKQEKQKVKEETYKQKPTQKTVEESVPSQFGVPQYEEEATSFDTQLSPKDVNKIVRIYSAFTKMDVDSQRTVVKFLNINSEKTTPENVVIAVLNASQSDYTLLSSLTELRNKSGAERAFELIAMPADWLIKLDKLVTNFSNDYKQKYSADDDKISYCRTLEKGISSISPNATRYLEPLERLLKITFS